MITISLTLVSISGLNLQDLLTKIGFSLTFDTIIVLFLVIAAFLYGISIGRKRMVIILISTYLAFAVFKVTPYLSLIKFKDASHLTFINIGLFLVYLAGFYFLLSGSKLASILNVFPLKGIRFWWQIFVLGILQTGLLVSIALTLSLEKFTIPIAPITELIFTKDLSVYLWFLAPILFLAFLKRKIVKKKREEKDEEEIEYHED